MTTDFMALPDPDSRCANYVCPNRVGQGAWVLVSLPVLPVSTTATLPAVRLSMCSPCATRLSHEIASEREGA